MSSKINFDFKSIRVKLWLCFAAITIGILALVWILQVFMLNNSYEEMKTNEVERVGTQITHAFSKDDETLTSTIQSLSQTSDIYVMMEYGDRLLLFTPEADSVMPVYKYRNETATLKRMLLAHAPIDDLAKPVPVDTFVSYRFSASTEKYNTLAFAKYITTSDGAIAILYIFSPLYPVTSTVSILRSQLTTVTIIAIFVAFIFAFWFSRRLTKPLKKITENAKKMGQGDYDVTFDTNSGYSEINKLAKTLNNAAYELGRADSLQKDLIANVSHDLKTPLTMIKSYAEMIRDLSGDNPEKRNTHLGVIMDEADRMADLVTDMSQVSQMQNAKIELNVTEFDLRATTESILSSFDILEEQDGYKFVFNAPKECFVKGDEARIKQVIANLTGNAVKYCGDNKEIAIIIRKIGKNYRFEVIDHGPGIAEEELIHVWDRYYRASENYSRTKSGTGLGLSIVKQILTLHDSEFGVESEVGSGSTFWFQLEAVKR